MKHKNKTVITAEPGQKEIVIMREFNASREKVFQLFINPALFVEWVGPRELMTTIETFDAVNGGSWHYIQSDAKGKTYAFHGVFHMIDEPESIIQTFEYEGNAEPGHVELETIKFEELQNGRTRLVSQSIYQSVADRDAMIQAGMEHGIRDSYERIDELLADKRASSH